MQLQTYEKRVGKGIADTTLDNRLSALQQFKKFVGNKEPTVQDVEDWVDAMIEEFEKDNIKASTIRVYYRAIASYWRAINGSDDPIDHVTEWFPKNDVDHGEYLTFKEWKKLNYTASSPRTSTFIDVMYFYARRPGEVLLLNKEDINLDDDTIMFNILKARNRANGTISVPTYDDGDTKEVLRATFELISEVKSSIEKYLMMRTPNTQRIYIDGTPKTVEPLFTSGNSRLKYSTMSDNIENTISKAGIDKNITPKSFRHTRATHLDIEGNEPGIIARQQLVHSPGTGTSVIQGYIHERSEEDVRDVIQTDD